MSGPNIKRGGGLGIGIKLHMPADSYYSGTPVTNVTFHIADICRNATL